MRVKDSTLDAHATVERPGKQPIPLRGRSFEEGMITTFSTECGKEHYIAIEAPLGLPFDQAMRELMAQYDALLADSALTRDSAVFWRFHVSDIFTQAQTLRQELADYERSVMISFMEQAPASGSKIAMMAYHLEPASGPFVWKPNGVGFEVVHGAYRSVWGRLLPQHKAPSYGQTTNILDTLSTIMRDHGGTVRDNVIRTWFYVRDIDNNYQGMVDARREWFIDEGMTPETHYIASTGIEGSAARVSDLVQTDYLAVLGLEQTQVEYMSALTHLNPTHEYGVTFERATKVTYGDRSHYYISGTASINNRGKVVHVGDVIKQTARTLENINALLDGYGATLSDMKMMVVYLRDSSDYPMVTEYLDEHMPAGTSYIVVKGAVCRPTWLIEMDGIAIKENGDPEFPSFC